VRKLALVVLVAGAFVALVFVWRSATDASRRYARIHDLVERNWSRRGEAWEEADALGVWNVLDWFSRKAPKEFDALLLASIREGDPRERHRAFRLVREVRRFHGYDQIGAQYGETRLPAPRGLESFSASAFEFPGRIARSAEILRQAGSHEDPEVRSLILWPPDDLPTAEQRSAMLAMAESDPHRLFRLRALWALRETEPEPASRSVLRRLLVDSDPLVRLGSSALLAVWGDCDALDVFLGFLLDRPRGSVLESDEWESALRFVAEDPGHLRWELDDLDRRRTPATSGELMDLIERLLYSLERRRIGEPSEPPPE
jgi:hypothetical protein